MDDRIPTRAHERRERNAGILGSTGSWRDAFERALSLHDQVSTPFERARTELCYAERLRRFRTRADGRARLRAALEVFESLGAVPWAERTRAELDAMGETVRRRAKKTDGLTARERAVAELVAGGTSNREAAVVLFVDTKTIEFHLANVYRKLGVRSRTQLMRWLLGVTQ
jgi:DNA-binding CsgD family transcriptional regulator